MTVETELPVREALYDSTADSSDAAELLRTMAAVVRTVFGVALQAPSDGHHEPPVAQVEAAPAAPVSLALPPEMPATIAMPEPVGLTIVPDPEPTTSAPSVAMPSISLGEATWTSPQTTPAPGIVIPEYSSPEPTAVHSAPPSIPVPTYVAPVAPIAPFAPEPSVDRHSLALLQEIAFLDD